MKMRSSGWHRWPVLVVAALLFGGISASGVVEDAHDTLYLTRSLSGMEVLSHLTKPEYATGVVKVIFPVASPDRSYETKSFAYSAPTRESPLSAELILGNLKGNSYPFALEFDNVDSKSGTALSLWTDEDYSFRFFTRASLTGAQNVSNRIVLHPGERNITGFVVQGERWVLIRGIGPSLAGFEVEQPVSDVTITLFNEDKQIAYNAQWGQEIPDYAGLREVFRLAGAFPLDEGTLDSALFLLLAPGAYTVHADSPSATEAGDALVEVYILPYE